MAISHKQTECEKWLRLCTAKNLFDGLANILHFALCRFVKSPLEATAVSIGSTINQHGRKQRYSLLPSSSVDEVQVAWNGPETFSTAATVIQRALSAYFLNHGAGQPTFTVSGRIKLASNTVYAALKMPSRTDFD